MKPFNSEINFVDKSVNKKVIIVGGGLTGLSAAIEALENGLQVVLIEKESKLGGNSAKASSGLNATPTKAQKEKKINDSIESFYQDTIKSGKGHSNEKLVRRLVEESSSSVEFIEKTGLEMSILSHLGGQTHSRTLRAKSEKPSNVGLMIMNAFEQKMKKIVEKEPERLKINLSTTVKELTTKNDIVNGIKIKNKDGEETIEGDAVVLATGGFSSSKPLLKKYAPSISHLPSTNGEWATGDGIYLAEKVGAQLKLMTEVQVHPTGIIDPNDPTNPTKILAGEALRGNGAMLICNGNRFVNEMGYRDFVSQKIFENCPKLKVSEEQSKKGDVPVVSFMILNQEAANLFEEAIKFYTFKKLVKKYENAKSFAEEYSEYISYDNLVKTFDNWNNYRKENGKGDEFKRPSYEVSYNENQPLYVIMVTPSVHYTMGGVAFDENARVLNNQNVPIKGLYAGGEITGGLHGLNRLGGNSLLECIVFGRRAIKHILSQNSSSY